MAAAVKELYDEVYSASAPPPESADTYPWKFNIGDRIEEIDYTSSDYWTVQDRIPRAERREGPHYVLLSNSGVEIQRWAEKVELECRVVGDPKTKMRKWKFPRGVRIVSKQHDDDPKVIASLYSQDNKYFYSFADETVMDADRAEADYEVYWAFVEGDVITVDDGSDFDDEVIAGIGFIGRKRHYYLVDRATPRDADMLESRYTCLKRKAKAKPKTPWKFNVNDTLYLNTSAQRKSGYNRIKVLSRVVDDSDQALWYYVHGHIRAQLMLAKDVHAVYSLQRPALSARKAVTRADYDDDDC